MASKSPSPAALMIVDNQKGFADISRWGEARSNPQYEANVSRLLAAFRKAGVFIIHIKHLSRDPESALHPSSPAKHPSGGMGVDIDENTTPLPNEPVIEKSVNSAFIGTDLEAVLRKHQVQTLFICGLTTDHCVSTTTRMAGNLHVCDVSRDVDGTKTLVPGRIVFVEDATACHKKLGGVWDAETVHGVHVESLREFAEIDITENVVKSLAVSV